LLLTCDNFVIRVKDDTSLIPKRDPRTYVGADVVGQVFSSVLNATITPTASPEAPVASVPAITAATTTPPVVTVLKKSLLPRTGASGLTALGLLGLALLFLGTESKRRSRLRNL
jgi:hypothetical protein